MKDNQQDSFARIARQLETKVIVKQKAYRILCHLFKDMEKETRDVIDEINQNVKITDKDVTINFKKISDHEFHLKVAGDLLVFFLHTNIITLDRAHKVNNSKALESDPLRRYFGQVMVYNFMADSLKYHRLRDPGYLVARFLVNCDGHFFIEGDGQLNFLFSDISENPVSELDLNVFIQLTIANALDKDLVAPPFPEIRTITLGQKLEKTQDLGGGQKIGFQMGNGDVKS